MELRDNITGLMHVGIPTNDIKKSVDFYKSIGFDVILDTKDGDVPVIFLKQGNLVVETYENHEAALRDGAVDHFAIEVKDLEDAYRQVTAMGYKVLTEISFQPFWDNGNKFFIIEGPNLERVEFAQYL